MQHLSTSPPFCTFTFSSKPWRRSTVNMTQIRSSDVLVEHSAEAVLVPLRDGICSINRVYESLIDADVDPFTGQCSDCSSIRQQIVEAQQSLERSEQAASTGLRGLDQNIEKLTEEEGKLEREKSDAERTLENLKTEQTSNEKLLSNSQSSLSQARSNLSSTRDALQRQEKRFRKAKTVRNVGFAVLAVPVVGWIAGAGMAIGGAIEMDGASDAIKVAEKEVRKSESHVETYKRKVQDYQSRIAQTVSDIGKKRCKVEQIRTGIRKAKEKKAAVADFQDKVRRAVRILSGLSGRAGVAESQTRRVVLKEPVMKVMEEVMKATADVAGNQLLQTKGIPSLINGMRNNWQKLAAIRTSHDKKKKRRGLKKRKNK